MNDATLIDWLNCPLVSTAEAERFATHPETETENHRASFPSSPLPITGESEGGIFCALLPAAPAFRRSLLRLAHSGPVVPAFFGHANRRGDIRTGT